MYGAMRTAGKVSKHSDKDRGTVEEEEEEEESEEEEEEENSTEEEESREKKSKKSNSKKKRRNRKKGRRQKLKERKEEFQIRGGGTGEKVGEVYDRAESEEGVDEYGDLKD